MRRTIAVAFAVATLFLLVPSMASSAFYGPPVGAQKKACARAGGTWIPHLQICVLPDS
jgi:hypothetical protein